MQLGAQNIKKQSILIKPGLIQITLASGTRSFDYVKNGFTIHAWKEDFGPAFHTLTP
jgi:hypothetical protein